MARIDQRLATRVNPREKNYGQPENQELDPPLHCSDGSAKRPLKIHQHQNGSDKNCYVNDLAGATKADPQVG